MFVNGHAVLFWERNLEQVFAKKNLAWHGVGLILPQSHTTQFVASFALRFTSCAICFSVILLKCAQEEHPLDFHVESARNFDEEGWNQFPTHLIAPACRLEKKPDPINFQQKKNVCPWEKARDEQFKPFFFQISWYHSNEQTGPLKPFADQCRV